MTDADSPFQPPQPFRCDVVRDGDTAWVRPAGELDLDSAPQLERELADVRATGCPRLVLDLRELTFMDSTGLRLVIRWNTAAGEEGFAFAVVPGGDVVQRVFSLTGMDEHVPVAEPPDLEY